MTTIYAYKFVDNKLDVFEAVTEAYKKSDNNFFPTRSWVSKDNLIMVKYTKCLINNSGKGITQHSKRCAWIIHKSETVHRNVMWMHEFNLTKAIEVFKKYNNTKIAEYNKLIAELEKSNEAINNSVYLCNHKNPDESEAIEQLPDGFYQCKICGRKFKELNIK